MCEDEHDGWEEWFSRKREAADRAQDLAEDDHPVSVYVIEVTGSADLVAALEGEPVQRRVAIGL